MRNAYYLVLIEPCFFRPDQDKQLLFLKFDADFKIPQSGLNQARHVFSFSFIQKQKHKVFMTEGCLCV